MADFYGLSRKERLKLYDPIIDKYKPYINCLREEDCRICKDRTACNTIATRKKMGIKNPWEY